MSTNTALLMLIPVLFALFYFVRKAGTPKVPTLGHRLLASGSVLHQIRRH